MEDIARAFQQGGPWMYPIAIALAISIAFVIERAYRLFFEYSLNGSSFMLEVQKHILGNDLDAAIRTCNGAKNAPLAKVLKAGLQRAGATENQIQNAIDAASLEVIPKLEKRIPYLATIANIATLLGLLGTISGLIGAFNAVSLADPAVRQALLANGISEAMNCTAFGLITAIFTMVAHSVLSNKANSIIESIDEFGVKILDLLSAKRFRSTS